MIYPDQRALLATFDFEITRLKRLGVRLKKMGAQSTRQYIQRFASEFVDPERNDEFIAVSALRPVDHVKWVRADRRQEAPKHGAVEWLASGTARCVCLRLDRRPGLPALEVRLDTMNESWVSSWPGVYVRFMNSRALVVTLDYEVLQCDLRSGRGSPYR